MKKLENLPNKIAVFPLSNFIIFPNTSVPLNIFEPRYVKMIDDSMKANRIIGMVQPRNKNKIPEFIVEDIPVPSAFNSLFTIPLHTEQP